MSEKVQMCRDLLSMIAEQINFSTCSPKGLDLFQSFQQEDESVNLQTFCPTWYHKAHMQDLIPCGRLLRQKYVLRTIVFKRCKNAYDTAVWRNVVALVLTRPKSLRSFAIAHWCNGSFHRFYIGVLQYSHLIMFPHDVAPAVRSDAGAKASGFVRTPSKFYIYFMLLTLVFS